MHFLVAQLVQVALEGRGGCVCAENSMIVPKTVEGWAVAQSWRAEQLGVRGTAVLLCTSAECGVLGGRLAPSPCALAEPRRFLPAVPLPPAVPRVCGGWSLRALPRGLQPAGIPFHRRRGLLRGGWGAVGAAPARGHDQKRATGVGKHPGLAKGIPKKNPRFS